MCYDPHLFHPSPSPPELISLHPHILISAYFLPQRVRRRNGWGWEGMGGRETRRPVGLGSLPSARLPVLNAQVIKPTNLGKYHSAYLLLISDYEDSWTRLPACQLLQIWVIYLCSHQHLSSFRYWLMQRSHTVQSIAHTMRGISVFLYSFVWSLESCHLHYAKAWWREEAVSPGSPPVFALVRWIRRNEPAEMKWPSSLCAHKQSCFEEMP